MPYKDTTARIKYLRKWYKNWRELHPRTKAAPSHLSKLVVDNIRGNAKLTELQNVSIHLNRKGYPAANVVRNGKKVVRTVHRLVMEQHLGRKLLASEIVHHVDHDRLNPAIENLELISDHTTHLRLKHSGLRGIGAVNAAKKLCSRGHPLTGRNLYLDSWGRHCRECRNLRRRERRKAGGRV